MNQIQRRFTVQIIGWKAGLKKVSLTKLLRDYGFPGLADAKHQVDQLLDGQRVHVDCQTIDSANRFIEHASKIGAICDPQFEADSA